MWHLSTDQTHVHVCVYVGHVMLIYITYKHVHDHTRTYAHAYALTQSHA